VAIAPLLVSIRTSGAAALGRLSASFRRLGAEIRVAYARFRLAGGIPGWLRRLPAHLRRASVHFRALAASIGHATRALIMYALASRVAQAASSGMARALTTMLPLFAKWAVIGTAAVAVGFPLIGVIGNLVPLIMLIAPAAGTAGLAVLGLKLAFNGVSDALQAGLSGDTEEFEKALKKLAPSAANAVRTLVKLRDTWKPLARDFQGRVFEGAAGELAGLSHFIKPIADTWLPKLAMRFAETRHELADGLARFAADGRLEAVWRNLHAAASAFLGIIKPIARVFGDVLQVAAPRFASLADTIAILATRFSDWIRAARDSGDLGRWLDKAMETFGKLKDVAANVGKIIGAIFKGSGNEGDDMLDQIVRATGKIAEWANGGDGQTIINIVSKIIQALGQLAPLFEMWAGWLRGMVLLWTGAWEAIKAIFRGVVMWILGGYDLLLQGAAKAFGWVPGLGDKLKSAQRQFEEFKNGVNRSLDGIEDEVVNITYHSRVIGDRLVSGSQLSGTYSSGIGGRAGGGPMRPDVQYRINEQGQEFIQLGSSGRAYSARESAAMGGGGSLSLAPATGYGSDPLTALVIRLFRDRKVVLYDSKGRPVRLAGA
jgi:hypothetical protein